MMGSSTFCHKHKTHQYTIKFHWVVLSGLFLLAAFPYPIGDLYEWSGSLMKLWWEGRGLCVTAKLCCVEWRSLLSLTCHFSWLWALCGPYQDLFHLFTFVWHFFINTLLAIGSPCSAIVELAWYFQLGANFGEKLSKLAGKLFFGYLFRELF